VRTAAGIASFSGTRLNLAVQTRASFGSVNKLSSGRWRVRATGPDGRRRSATFNTKADARAWLATQQADVVRRAWRAPEAGKRTVGDYAADYLERDDLRASTLELYNGLWTNHLEPYWADAPVGDITAAQVRAWHTAAAKTTGPTALAQSYRLLRSLLNVAVADEVIAVNPCRLRSAGTPKPARPSRALTSAEVAAIAEAVPGRYRALVLVLAYGGLRFGEATALRRADVLPDGRLRIERSVRYLGNQWVYGEPKTDAGRRTVALPAAVSAALTQHLETFVPDDDEALVFGTATGTPPATSNWNETFRRATNAVGLPPVRPH
jgi:integrase